jgi:hypothetical protein
MHSPLVEFNYEQLDRLFPFFMIINEDCKVVSVGSSFKKVTNINIGTRFQDAFVIIRPHQEVRSLDDLIKLKNELCFFNCLMDSTLTLRGQFEYYEYNKTVLFVGTPWFYSMDNVTEKQLTLSDFALHDPMMDLLHVLKTAEMASDDLKQLVKTIEKQKLN